MRGWNEGDIESNGLNIHFYRTGGAKPALLLAHGFSDNGLCWTRVTKALESSFDVVMVDARNHGKSDAGAAGIEDLAGDLAAVISELDLVQPAVMGHSVGASVVAGLAAFYPQLVSRIVLEDPPWTLPRGSLDPEKKIQRSEGFRKFAASLAGQSEEQIVEDGKKLNVTWHDDDFPAWAASKRQVSLDAMGLLDLGDWTDIVPRIQCPAYLIYADSDKDGIVSASLAKEVERRNSQFSTHHVIGAGHNVRREQFDGFITAVSEFLRS